MNVWIARDGETLGEYPREELDARAQAGEFERTDHYWHEGMENWRELDELLGLAAWVPAPVQKPAPPSSTSRFGGARAISFALGGALGIYLLIWGVSTFRSFHSDAAAAAASSAPSNDGQVRDKAVADLNGRLDALPGEPSPPTNAYYYGVAVNLSKATSSFGLWTASISGQEDTVEPETKKARFHTSFMLTTEYRNGSWTFKQYIASTTNIETGEIVNIDEGEGTVAPPSLAIALDLKIEKPTGFSIGR
ncbi:MAG: DUF4339 domain-containing protein [Chthoniobacterales bacterium]